MKVSYFAKTRELMGRDNDEVDFPAPVRTINDAIDYLTSMGEPYCIAFADKTKLRFALDNELSGADAGIANISELAIFPPVTGG